MEIFKELEKMTGFPSEYEHYEVAIRSVIGNGSMILLVDIV